MTVRLAIGLVFLRLAMGLARVGAWIAGIEAVELPSRAEVMRFEAWRAAWRRDQEARP